MKAIRSTGAPTRRSFWPAAAALLLSASSVQGASDPAPASADSQPSEAIAAEASANASASTTDQSTVTPARALPTSSGFEPGFRSGVELPVGKAGDTLDGQSRSLFELTPWRIPIWVDVNYRFNEGVVVGVYGQSGFGGTGDDYCEGECTFADLRLGVQGQWRFTPGRSMVPWLGVGLGYQWQTFRDFEIFTSTDGAGTLRRSELLGGPELLLQGGLDFDLGAGLRAGPFASATASQFLSSHLTCNPSQGLDPTITQERCPDGADLEGGAFHAWFALGLRGSYAP